MYPRLSPKTNNFCVKVKNSLNIIDDDQKKKMVQTKINTYLDDDCQVNKFLKVKTLVDQNQKEPPQSSLNHFSSKQNNRHSSYLNQLPEKFNHLRGKRRSLQMALMLYQQIQDEKDDSMIDSTQIYKKKNSLHKFSHSSSKKKPSFHRLGYTKILDGYNQSMDKNAASLRFRHEIKQPLGQIRENEMNKERGKNEEYNFINKSMRKKSFFKNRIMDQILQNNIDQWQYEPANDQNQIFPKG